MPLNREITTDESILAGSNSSEEKKQRVLSLVDKLNREGAITVDMYLAAGHLRNQIMMELPPSAGVSSYGQNVRATEPSSKADRAGRRHTGYQIQPDGSISYAGGRKSRRNERALEDALFAACGCHDDEGQRKVNAHHAELLIRAVSHTENMPTLGAITQELTSYYGARSKQSPPFALGVIWTMLGRLALHYKMSK